MVDKEDLNNHLEIYNLPQLVEEEDLSTLLENSNSPQLVENGDLSNVFKNLNSPQSVANGDLNTLLKNYNSPEFVKEDLNTLLENYITPYSDIVTQKIEINNYEACNGKKYQQRSRSLFDKRFKPTTLNCRILPQVNAETEKQQIKPSTLHGENPIDSTYFSTQCDNRLERGCKAEEKRHNEYTLLQQIRNNSFEKSFMCNQCGKAFVERSHLTYHLRTHSWEKSLKYDRCENAKK